MKAVTISREDQRFRNYLGRWEYDNTSETGNQIVNAYLTDKVVGSLKWNLRGEIEHIWVDPDFEGQGIMRKMLRFYDGDPRAIDPAMFVDESLFQKVLEIVAFNNSGDFALGLIQSSIWEEQVEKDDQRCVPGQRR